MVTPVKHISSGAAFVRVSFVSLVVVVVFAVDVVVFAVSVAAIVVDVVMLLLL